MHKDRCFAAAALVTALALPLAGCFGGKHEDGPRSAGSFQVQATPAGLIIPAGGGGFVTVTTTRPLPHFLDYQGPLTLSLDGAPAGITGSGSITADHTSGTLALQVDAAVPPQVIQALRVKAVGGGAVAEVAFALTIAPPLPPGQIRADLVQASGRAQTGGTLANTPVIQEPVAARSATDTAQVVAVRHGFDPNAASH
ncbi:MAG TPA: hypothetical protein VF804_04760 [Holophagaceae bacterium]